MQKNGHQCENQHEGSVQLACNLLQEKTGEGKFGYTTSDVRSALDGVYHLGYHLRLGESTLRFGTTTERSHQHFQGDEHLTNSVLNNMDYYSFTRCLWDSHLAMESDSAKGNPPVGN